MVDLQAKPDDFVALYASASADPTMSAKVPLIQDDDDVLIESMVILDYLEDIAPGELTARQRARSRLFATLWPGKLSSIGILKTEAGSEAEAQAVAKLRQDLRAMDAFLSETNADGPYLHGSEFSYAEYACAPFAARLAVVLPGLRPELDPLQWMKDDLPRLHGWFEATCARASCVDTLPPPDELTANYAKLVERMKAMAAAA